MILKRFIATILSLGTLISIGITPVSAANEMGASFGSMDEDICYNGSNDFIDPYTNLVELNTLQDSNTYEGYIDSSNVVDITADVLSKTDDLGYQGIGAHASSINTAEPTMLLENQPPVANPMILVKNSDSMKDGQPTTETVIIIATRYNNTDLCYDPEGGTIEFYPFDALTYNPFPKAYYKNKITSYNKGSIAGFEIRIFNAGLYPILFFFADPEGGTSDIFSMNLEIVPQGTFQTIDGELNSATEVDVYPITVDFSTANEYSVGLLRTGTGGFDVSVYYEDGKLASSGYTTGPDFNQRIGYDFSLKKPDGVYGEYTYTLRVTSYVTDFVEGDTKYRIAYGEASQKYYFFDGVANCLNLPYCTLQSQRDSKGVRAVYSQWSPTNENGHYYKITTTGPEVVTLASFYAPHRFKILDCDTFEELYDSKNLVGVDYECESRVENKGNESSSNTAKNMEEQA